MIGQRVVRSAIKMSALGLFGMGLLVVDSGLSFAGNCGGHCQQMKVCADLMNTKGLKGGQRRAEFNKCMADPHNYK